MLKIPKNFILYVSIFVTGGCGLAYEYTLSKIASDILGNSVRQWAIIIAVMMFFMGIGSELQKYIRNQKLLDKFILAELALGLLGGFGPIVLLASYGQWQSHYIIIQYFFICSIGLLIGFEIPLLTRINEKYNDVLGSNLGNVLKMDYIGSLFGALLWVFVLPKFFTLIEMAFVLGFLNIFVAGITILVLQKSLFHFKSLVALLCLSMALIGFGFVNSSQWTSYSEQHLYRDKIVHSQTTPYQHIVLTESPLGDLSCYINGHLQFNSFDEHIYHEVLVHPTLNMLNKPQRALVLGGGDGMAVRELLKYEHIQEIVLVDLDSSMTNLAQNNPLFVKVNQGALKNAKVRKIKNRALIPSGYAPLILGNQKRPYSQDFQEVKQLKVINVDAIAFLEQIPGLFDVIILDFPDPHSIELAKLYSKGFYHLLEKHLSPRGLFIQQSTSPIFAKEAFLSIGRTIQAASFNAIPIHQNVPTFGEWGFWIAGRQEEWNYEQLKMKLQSITTLPTRLKFLTPELTRNLLHFGKEQLDTREEKVTTISQAAVYDYYLEGWLQ